MERRFIITRYCPVERIFDGLMTFSSARCFMDEHASFERPVGFKVFNERLDVWQDFGLTFRGNYQVFDKDGELYLLSSDYKNIWHS